MQSSTSNRSAVRAWILYDWANSAFATTIMAAVLPTFYSSVAAAGLLTPVQASSRWGFTQTIGMLLVALTAPALGAIADYSGSKKRFLAAFAIPGILATALMVFLTTGSWLWASLLYIVGEIGFSGSLIFYDSLLPHVAKEDEIDMVSAKGYAMGYLGGGILLAINILWIMMPATFGMEALGARFGVSGTEMATRMSFLSVAVWWAVFSIPLFRKVKEPRRARLEAEKVGNPITGGFARLGRTFKELRSYRQLLIFIVAFWIYNDGIGTIMKMATIYGAEIGIGTIDLIGALLLTQFIGIPFSLLFGRLAPQGRSETELLLEHGHLQRDCATGGRHPGASAGHHQRADRGGYRPGCAGHRTDLLLVPWGAHRRTVGAPDERQECDPAGAGGLRRGIGMGFLPGHGCRVLAPGRYGRPGAGRQPGAQPVAVRQHGAQGADCRVLWLL